MDFFGAPPADTPFDHSHSSVNPHRAYVAFVRLAGTLAFVLAVLILLGWSCDITLLKSGLPGQRATQPLTALCFAFSALSLGLSTERCVLCRVFTRVCALLVLGVAIVTVWQNALDVDWGLDRLLFPEAVVHEQPGQYLRPGRPAAGTLVALALLSSCLLLTRARSRAARALFVWLSTVGVLLSAAVVLAYAYSLNAIYAMGFYCHVGFNSGIALVVLFCGVLLRRPDLGWMRLLAGDSVGAASARRMLLWSGSLLVVLAVIVKLGTSAALYGAGFEATLLSVGGLGVLLVALLSHARRLNALETIRHNVTSDLRSAETRLLRAAHDKDQQLARLAHELRNPLTPLRNGIEILRWKASGDPSLARTADMMDRQIVRLVRLVDELVGTAEPAPTVVAPQPLPLAATPESTRLRILVADDNADGADSLAMVLQAQGHVVLTAPDGRRAVELAETFQPDVILMDVAMPNLDGLEATRQIRLRPWGARIRIIALTAWGQNSERQRTHDAGMDFHLVKPVDPQALAAVLRAEAPSG
jgi:CheY-like chemotaxis protein/signal transduction histidine kinase